MLLIAPLAIRYHFATAKLRFLFILTKFLIYYCVERKENATFAHITNSLKTYIQ